MNCSGGNNSAGVSPARKAAFSILTLLAAAFWVGAPAVTRADEEAGALERSVKAAFLYKIAGYVEWPAMALPRADEPFTIGVVGEDALANDLAGLTAGRTLHDRRIAVTRLREAEPLDRVQILFVGRACAARLSNLVRPIRERPILIVTESEGALAQGSVINFVIAEGRVRFEISIPAASRSGLQLSSRLLGVAQSVVTRGL